MTGTLAANAILNTGTREYLAFVTDSPVACGGIAALDFKTRMVTSGFVKVVVP